MGSDLQAIKTDQAKPSWPPWTCSYQLLTKTCPSACFATSPSRFDNAPSLRTIRVSSRVKSLKRTLQGTLRPASRQSWIPTSLGQSFPAEVIIARIDCS